MAFASGKAGVFKVDDSGGSLTDISAYTDDVTFPQTVDTPETTTFGKSTKTRIVGLKDGSFSAKGPWDPTLDAHLAGILGHSTSKSYEYGPTGSTAAMIKYTGEAFLASYQVNTPVAGRVEWNAQFVVSDTVSRGAYT